MKQLISFEEYNEHKNRLLFICQESIKLLGVIDSIYSKRNYSKINLIIYKDILTNIFTSLNDDKFIVSVIGELKKGKSSLLNVLMRKEGICPTDVLEKTAKLSIFIYNEDEKAVVTFLDGQSKEIQLEELENYITKDGRFSEKTKYVKVYLKNEYLKNSVWLVDTPGVNTTDDQREKITLNWLSKSDAAIFLVTPSELISNSEKKFLVEKVYEENDIKSIMVVMNKIDLVEEDELYEQMNYVIDKINQLTGYKIDRIFPVSSRKALKSIRSGDTEVFKDSGFIEFEEALQEFLLNERGKAKLLKRINQLLKQFLNPVKGEIKIIRQISNIPLEEFELQLRKLKSEKKDIKSEIDNVKKTTKTYFYEVYNELENKIREEINLFTNDIRNLFGEKEFLTNLSNTENIQFRFTKIIMQTKNYVLKILNYTLEKILNEFNKSISNFIYQTTSLIYSDYSYTINYDTLTENVLVEKSFFRKIFDAIKFFFTGNTSDDYKRMYSKTKIEKEIKNFQNDLKEHYKVYLENYFDRLNKYLIKDLVDKLKMIEENLNNIYENKSKAELEISEILNELDSIETIINNLSNELIDLEKQIN